jgi:predicted ATPase
MVTGILGDQTLPPSVVEQILAKTDGVPLFVEELTKSVVESANVKSEGATSAQSGTNNPQIAIPATLRDSLMARLDRFAPVKEIAQIGAAIGRDFSYELISAVATMPQAQLDDALVRLTESGLAFRRGTPPDATYTFKHALVQDAAYDSLLKSRRQELHGKIARVIQERFPTLAGGKPEVLAHHYTQATQLNSAIPLWQKAGELAVARFALTESISHLNKGLELVASLPASVERDATELALRMPLGTALFALKGWAEPEVWNSLHPAMLLARSLNRSEKLLVILTYLMTNVMTQGRVAESLHWMNEILDTVKATGDPDVLIYGHGAAGLCYFNSGRLTETIVEADKLFAIYDEPRHRHLTDLFYHDYKTVAGTYISVCTWMLGYPDRAARLAEENEVHSRRLAHPFDLGFALYFHAYLFDLRGEPAEVRKRAKECDTIGRDNSLPPLSMLLAPWVYGLALMREGRIAEGIGSLETGVAAWQAGNGRLYSPYINSIVAGGKAHLGDHEGALELIDQQIAEIERPGWGEKLYYAEILRLKGSILSMKGDLEGAEQAYNASLDWARQQEAKSWQLRTSMSLARLWQSQGKSVEAYKLLAPLYNWFTEGFDTADLKEAKALLKELAPTV